MYGHFAAQAGVITSNPIFKFTSTLTWNFNNVIVLDFDPPGSQNINDRPRINTFRVVNGVIDPNFSIFISGGENVLSPCPSGTILKPWGDRKTGTLVFPQTFLGNNIVAGVDVFTHTFALPVNIQPPINEWTITNTGPAEIKYQYLFKREDPTPQINIDLRYNQTCIDNGSTTIAFCHPNRDLVFEGTGSNGCPIFICKPPALYSEIGSLYNINTWTGNSITSLGSWNFSSGTDSTRLIANSNSFSPNGRVSIGNPGFFAVGPSGISTQGHSINFPFKRTVKSGCSISIDANYAYNGGLRNITFYGSNNNTQYLFSHGGNDAIRYTVPSLTNVISPINNISVAPMAYQKAFRYILTNLGTGYLTEVRDLSSNESPIYSHLITGNLNWNNFITGVRIEASGSNNSPGFPPIDWYNYGLFFNNLNLTYYANLTGAITNLNISAITTTGALVSWNPINNVDYYSLDVSTGLSFTSTLTNYTNRRTYTNSLTLTGLSIGSYNVRVKAVNPVDSGQYVSTNFVTAGVTLPAPTGFRVANVTNDLITYEWSPVAGATEYTIQLEDDPAFQVFFESNYIWTANTSATFSNLTPNATYYARVRVNQPSFSPDSLVLSRTTPLDPPEVGTIQGEISSNIINLEWPPVVITQIHSYYGQIATDAAFVNIVAVNSVQYNNIGSFLDVSMTFSNLGPGTTYYIRIRTDNVNGNGGFSFPNLVLTTLGSPQLPVAPNVPSASLDVNLGANNYIISWNQVVGATSYRLDISTVSNFSSFVAGFNNKTAPTIVDNAQLTPGTTYYIRVRAVNSVGTSANSPTLTVTFVTPPTAPTSLTPTNVTLTSFTVLWNTVSTATSYRIDVATDSSFTSFVAGYNNLTVASATQSITGLTAGTTYFVRVRAVNAGGTSPNSTTLTIPTLMAAPTATSVTDTSFTANWNAVATATSYRLDVSTSSTFASFVGVYNNLTVNGTSQSITGLTAATTYYVRVRAVDNGGTLTSSLSLTQTTAFAPPNFTDARSANQINLQIQLANSQYQLSLHSYYVELSTNSSFTNIIDTRTVNYTVIGSPTVTTIYTGLTNINYYVRARTINSNGTSNFSSTYIVPPVP